MSETENQVLQALHTYQSAVLARNVDALLQLYDAEARVFDAWGVWSYEGAAAWRVSINGWLSSLGSETVRVTFDDVKIAGRQDFATMSAIVTYAAISAQGQELRSLQNRMSWVLEAVDGVLRVIHEHTSVPVSFDHMTAILRREGGP